jgi:hypothetical protein
MNTNALTVGVFASALFVSLILLQNFIEIVNTRRDLQPNTTYAMTWVCVVLWSVFFALQITK